MNKEDQKVRDTAIRGLIRRDAQAAQVAADAQTEVKWEQEQMTKLKAAADEQLKLSPEEQERQFNDALSKLRALTAKNKNRG